MFPKTYATFYVFRPGIIVLRVLGFGFQLASYEVVPALFSEREGITKPLFVVGDWRMHLLTPWR